MSAWYHIVLAVDTTNSNCWKPFKIKSGNIREQVLKNSPDENEDLAINVDGEVTYIASEAYTSG